MGVAFFCTTDRPRASGQPPANYNSDAIADSSDQCKQRANERNLELWDEVQQSNTPYFLNVIPFYIMELFKLISIAYGSLTLDG
jgi:hypothetical protein